MPESPLTSISRLRQVLRIVAAAPRAGLAGGLLLICCAFMLLFQGFGVGLGTSTSSAGADSPQNSTTPESSPASPRSLDTPSTPTPSDTDINSLPPQPALTILIDERSYRIQVPADPEPVYRECSLQQVLSLAAKTTGDVNDIRIRILRRETARQSAETALLEALEATGIGIDAILMPSTTVP
jgi:hypothetical protein